MTNDTFKYTSITIQMTSSMRMLMMTSSNGNIFRVTSRLSPVNSPHKGQWRGALMFSLIYVWINGSVSTREAGDWRRYRAHYDVIVMSFNMHPCAVMLSDQALSEGNSHSSILANAHKPYSNVTYDIYICIYIYIPIKLHRSSYHMRKCWYDMNIWRTMHIEIYCLVIEMFC